MQRNLGNLATINDKEENNWLSSQMYGSDKASAKLNEKFALSGEPLRGTALWLGHTNHSNNGNYESITGDKKSDINWAPEKSLMVLVKGKIYCPQPL